MNRICGEWLKGLRRKGMGVMVREGDGGKSKVDQPEVGEGGCIKGNPSGKFVKWP